MNLWILWFTRKFKDAYLVLYHLENWKKIILAKNEVENLTSFVEVLVV